MKTEDRWHIQQLTDQYGARMLSEGEAMWLSIQAGNFGAVLYAASWAGRKETPGGGLEDVLFLDEDEFEGDDAKYITGLHEAGHIVLGHLGKAANQSQAVDNEIEAWAWAFANAKRDLTESDEAVLVMLNSLSTYTDDLAETTRRADWSKRHFEAMRVGASWAVPRSGLIFLKPDERTLALDLVMPWTPEMGQAARDGRAVPPTKEKLIAYQRDDFKTIAAAHKAAGIEVSDPKGLLPSEMPIMQ